MMTKDRIERLGIRAKNKAFFTIKPVFRGLVATSAPVFDGLRLERFWSEWDSEDGVSVTVWWAIRGDELHYAIQITSTGEMYGTTD